MPQHDLNRLEYLNPKKLQEIHRNSRNRRDHIDG